MAQFDVAARTHRGWVDRSACDLTNETVAVQAELNSPVASKLAFSEQGSDGVGQTLEIKSFFA